MKIKVSWVWGKQLWTDWQRRSSSNKILRITRFSASLFIKGFLLIRKAGREQFKQMSSSFEFPSQPWLLWVRVGFSTGKEKTAPESPEVWEREMKETSRTNTSVAEDISKVPEYKYLYKINQSTKGRNAFSCEMWKISALWEMVRWCIRSDNSVNIPKNQSPLLTALVS